MFTTGMKQYFGCKKSQAAPPNLKRFAVVSASLRDEHERPINDVLNANIELALDDAVSRADKTGYAPEAEWTESEEAKAAYKRYYDI